MRARLALVTLFFAAYGAGDSVAEISVVTTAGTVLPLVSSLVVVANLCFETGTCQPRTEDVATPITVDVDRTIPPSVDFALRFDKSIDARVWVQVTARDASGRTLASSGATLEIAPSRSTSATVKLVGTSPPDMAPVPPDMTPPPPCDPVTQSGCTLLSQKCTASGRCEPGGTVSLGQPCTRNNASDNCVKGASCEGGYCREMCNTDPDCTGVWGPGNGNRPRCVEYTNLTPHRCTLPCNPVPQAGPSGCASGQRCIYTRNDDYEYTTCTTPGTATTGPA
jgi:hypothetical protein